MSNDFGLGNMVLDMMDTEVEPEDYKGEDGLLYCGKCHTPKEAYFPQGKTLFGRDRHPSECDCRKAEREKWEKEETEKKHNDKVELLKREGFTDPAMRVERHILPGQNIKLLLTISSSNHHFFPVTPASPSNYSGELSIQLLPGLWEMCCIPCLLQAAKYIVRQFKELFFQGLPGTVRRMKTIQGKASFFCQESLPP